VTVIEEPAHLGRREVRIEHESRRGAHDRRRTTRVEFVAVGAGAPVLPDDGAVGESSRRTVEGDRCLALIGDAERDDVMSVRACSRGDVAQRRDARAAISLASCSTSPGRGKCWVSSRCAVSWTVADRSKATVRTPDVPASRARTSSTGVRLLRVTGWFSSRSLG